MLSSSPLRDGEGRKVVAVRWYRTWIDLIVLGLARAGVRRRDY